MQFLSSRLYQVFSQCSGGIRIWKFQRGKVDIVLRQRTSYFSDKNLTTRKIPPDLVDPSIQKSEISISPSETLYQILTNNNRERTGINGNPKDIFVLRGRKNTRGIFELSNFYRKSGSYVVSGLYRPFLSEILRSQLPRSSEKKLETDGSTEVTRTAARFT